MDNIWLVGILTSAYITAVGAGVVAFVNRSNGKARKPYNGEERRAFRAAIDEHTLSCPNTTRIEAAMTEGFNRLGNLLETHRNQAHN